VPQQMELSQYWFWPLISLVWTRSIPTTWLNLD